MSLAVSERLREVVAGLIHSPLYFNLAPVQRLSLVKSLAERPCLRPRAGCHPALPAPPVPAPNPGGRGRC